MYPAQTSFIPVTVALAKFIESDGFGGLYPYWYLGSTPFKYLAGPVVPGILVGLHRLLPDFSLFDLSYIVILVSFFIGALGWGILAAKLSGQRVIGVIGGIGVLILPWRFFSAMAFSEVSAVLASSLLPWLFIAFVRSVRHTEKTFGQSLSKTQEVIPDLTQASARQDHKSNSHFLIVLASSCFSVWFPSLILAVLLLTNTTASIPAIVGLLILSISNSKYQIANIKRVGVVILVGWLLTLWWYTPVYWWTILGAPSFGGKSAAATFISVVNLLRSFVPIILAFVIVLMGLRPRGNYQKFALSWLAIFGILTLLRFLADPDFWMDWTSWMGEVEVGLALVGARIFHFPISIFHIFSNLKIDKLTNKWQMVDGKWKIAKNHILLALLTAYFFVGWFFAWQNRDFWLPRKDISHTVEYKIASFLSENVKPDETVFLSGSTAFWLNSLSDVRQVRGGRDEASVDPSTGSGWREAAWEIRSGLDPKKSERLVRELGIDYLVIHTNKSSEYYHDFEDPGKFEKIDLLAKVYEEDGDIVLKLLSFRIGDDN